jgi:hypothetical protein
MKIITAYIVPIVILCTTCSKAQPITRYNTIALTDSAIQQHITMGLAFLAKEQHKETSYGKYYEGEWPNYMSLDRPFLLLGTSSKYEDSNCFTVAGIYNILADIYLKHPHYTNIKPMLLKAYPRIKPFKHNLSYNFWNALPPLINHKKNSIPLSGILVRRPTNYPLRSRFINKAANIVEDADDTSFGYLAELLHQKIFGGDSITSKDTLALLYDSYIDKNRNNIHPYNAFNGNVFNTGAFTTWHGKEYEFKLYRHMKAIFHFVVFLFPFSASYPHAYIPYMPYGTNDVDAVVNCNVLYCLQQYNAIEQTKAANNALTFIEKKARTQKYDRVGVYYPNRYHFPYAVGKLYASGMAGLENTKKYVVDFLLKKQQKNGSWHAMKKLRKKDALQSTIYAVHALLNLHQHINDPHIRAAIDKGMQYIFVNTQYVNNQCYWKGGVFFSGGTVVRSNLTWKSDALTTAIYVQAMTNYLLKTKAK